VLQNIFASMTFAPVLSLLQQTHAERTSLAHELVLK